MNVKLPATFAPIVCPNRGGDLTIASALAKAKLDRVRVCHRPRLLSDNDPCYVSGELSRFLESRGK